MPNEKPRQSTTMKDLLTPKLTVYKPKVVRFSQDEQDLRDLWNVQLNDMSMPHSEYDLPPIPQAAPMFRKQPVVYGKRLADMLEDFFRIAPELRGRVTALMSGPLGPAISSLAKSGLDASQFSLTNLLGVTGVTEPYKGNISLNPRLHFEKFDPRLTEGQVLAHELTHAAGYGDENMPTYAEDKYRRVKGLPKIEPGSFGWLDVPTKEFVKESIARRRSNASMEDSNKPKK